MGSIIRTEQSQVPVQPWCKPRGFTSQSTDVSWSGVEFDRTLQITSWQPGTRGFKRCWRYWFFQTSARAYSLLSDPATKQPQTRTFYHGSGHLSRTGRSNKYGGDVEVEECADLMSRLNLAIDAEEPPVHLEKGVRLIHSLRSRMMMCADTMPLKPRANRRTKQYRPAANRVDAADRATVDLLFWLGVMFDTLSSAMHRRPLVLSDEDSNVYANEPKAAADQTQHDVGSVVPRSTEGVWDVHLFAHQRTRLQQHLVRWPCSFEQAAALLCDAAPVKARSSSAKLHGSRRSFLVTVAVKKLDV